MKNNKTYYSLQVSNNENEIVGIVVAESSEELNRKVKWACDDHWDCDAIMPIDPLDYETCKGTFSSNGFFEFNVVTPDWEFQIMIKKAYIY